MTAQSLWMTETARHKLQEELAELERDTARPATARILELRELLRSAEVGRKPDDGLVEPGMRVTIRFDHDRSEATFLLSSREFTGLDPAVGIDLCSPTSPLGRAINGSFVGDTVTFLGPAGQLSVSILAATPFG